MQTIKTDKRNVAQVAPATIAAVSPAEVSPHGDTLPAPPLRPMRWDGVEELTYTEGAMIEALRRLRRIETDAAPEQTPRFSAPPNSLSRNCA